MYSFKNIVNLLIAKLGFGVAVKFDTFGSNGGISVVFVF